ncbi:hypothetical protein EVAR_73604_1 [Eumeta japonica]|uniref:Uncharacterized protein n=1 Tax=Eumeta variegata TaxID=151549 RepID=A0A4C1THM6_EUMVA|nr:hypothetical protein EVAR_73604_1 [Eumeta japonica]
MKTSDSLTQTNGDYSGAAPQNAHYQYSVTTVKHTDTRPNVVSTPRCVKYLTDYGTAQDTRKKDTGRTTRLHPMHPHTERPRARSQLRTHSIGSRNSASTAEQNQSSPADDLKQLMSITFIIDTNKLAILTKKFRATANQRRN